MMPSWQIQVGDVREVLATLPSASVHCCVTSPPYWGLRMYLPADAVMLRADLAPEELEFVNSELRRLGLL